MTTNPIDPLRAALDRAERDAPGSTDPDREAQLSAWEAFLARPIPAVMQPRLYVVGFGFDFGRNRVVLIRKKRPAWQAGRFNGIGGKVEPGESPPQAMAREAEEEAGLPALSWELFATLRHTGGLFHVRFYRVFSDHTKDAYSRTDEEVVHMPIGLAPFENVVPNLRVLIPLALDQSGIDTPVALTDSAEYPA